MSKKYTEQEEQKTPWFAFVNPGDKVGGYIQSFYYKEAADGFGAQRVFLLKQKDGSLIYVPLKETARCFTSSDELQTGDFLGVKLDTILAPSSPGKHGAKIFTIFPKFIGERNEELMVKNYKANVGDAVSEFPEYDLPQDPKSVIVEKEGDELSF